MEYTISLVSVCAYSNSQSVLAGVLCRFVGHLKYVYPADISSYFTTKYGRVDGFNVTFTKFRFWKFRPDSCLIANSTWNGVTITNCSFSRCTFRNCTFKNVHFINCVFAGVDFHDVSFQDSLITHTNISETSFKACFFVSSGWYSNIFTVCFRDGSVKAFELELRRSSFFTSPRTTNTFKNNNKKYALATPTYCRVYTEINIIKY
jgi:uncharacterized protein YjbI with pentapeptide repeats